LHPDAVVSEDDLDDAFVSTEDNAIPLFTGDEEEELSEIGRVRSDFFNDNRFMPY
jgi:nucleotide-sensitive chloride channel 1A